MKGFCENVLGLMRLGLLDDQPHPSLQSNHQLTWKEFLCDLLNLKHRTPMNTLRSTIMQRLENENQLDAIEKQKYTIQKLLFLINASFSIYN